jgi:hypothetical protein
LGSGASVARTVAQLVLLDGRFSSLPSVLAEGRRVIANVERLAGLFVTKTVYAFLLAFAVDVVAVIFPFLPRHLTLVGAVTIGVPAFCLSLAPNAARAKPGFAARVLRFAVPAGFLAFVATFAAYLMAGGPLGARGGTHRGDSCIASRWTVDSHDPLAPTDDIACHACRRDGWRLVARAAIPEPLRRVVIEEGIRALALIPLQLARGLIGKFVAYYNDPHAFPRAEVDLAVIIARILDDDLLCGARRRRFDCHCAQSFCVGERVRPPVYVASAAARAAFRLRGACLHQPAWQGGQTARSSRRAHADFRSDGMLPFAHPARR